jgi:hypothetical protein
MNLPDVDEGWDRIADRRDVVAFEEKDGATKPCYLLCPAPLKTVTAPDCSFALEGGRERA